jgi:hypothetical protein
MPSTQHTLDGLCVTARCQAYTLLLQCGGDEEINRWKRWHTHSSNVVPF